jgi:hypothetical protein
MATLYDMVDRALGGDLAGRLAAMRADGRSIDEMTAEIAATGFPVSRETVRRWCKQVGVPTERAQILPFPGPERRSDSAAAVSRHPSGHPGAAANAGEAP